MGFKIEKGVPVESGRSAFKAMYPFREMTAGDSFVVPLSGEVFRVVYGRLYNAGKQYAVRNDKGFKFCVRPEGKAAARFHCLEVGKHSDARREPASTLTGAAQ